MKSVMVILCSLVLLAAPVLMALPGSPCGSPAVSPCGRACCRPGHMMSCCAESRAAHSQPAPASSPRAAAQNDFSLLALALLTSVAPRAEVRPPFSPAPAPLLADAPPLHERHCVRLI